MSFTKNFIANLFWRFNNENDLSDITYTMCQSSEGFKFLFLNFFFPEVSFMNMKSITREISKEDSRADFVIANNDEIFIIECKLGDKRHHFEQYTRTYKIAAENLGYIVNYNHVENGFKVKTWKQFHDYLEFNMPQNQEEISLFEGYIEYLRSVCGIIKITQKMELEGIYSLHGFNQILKSVVSRSTDDFELSYYANDFKESYYGYKFQVQDKRVNHEMKKEDVWLNVGIWFNYKKPVITIGVWRQKGWGKPFCDKLDTQIKHQSIYAKERYFEDATYYFEATHKFYEEFINARNPQEQQVVLCHFVDEVVTFYLTC